MDASKRKGERRQVTVLFTDLVKFTHLSHRLDPEDLEAVVEGYHKLAGDIVMKFGGTVEEYLGDGVLAVFGLPVADEDAADVAVRAARAIIEAVPDIEVSNQSMMARAGIATGEVVQRGRSKGDELRPRLSGAVLSAAAKLQSAAEPGHVIVTEISARLARNHWKFRFMGQVDIAGDGIGVGVFEPTPFEQSSDLPPTLNAFQGRETELAILQASAPKGSAPRGVIVQGAAGIGKSSLIAEYQRLLDLGVRRLKLQAEGLNSNTAFFPIKNWIRQQLPRGLVTVEAVKKALPGMDVDQVYLLHLLCGGEDSQGVMARYTPAHLLQQYQGAIVALFLHLAADTSLLLIWEDLHWMDDASIQLFKHALEKLPKDKVQTIGSVREETDVLSSIENLPVHYIDLIGTPPDISRGIVAHISDGRLSDEVIGQILARADNIPLYLEQLTLSILESGAKSEVPATLKDLLQTRIDRMGPSKSTAQIASVVGREFDQNTLHHMAELDHAQIAGDLEVLTDAGVILKENETYRFSHALLRDAVYSTILRKEKQGMHCQIAEMLSLASSTATGVTAEKIANHFIKGQRILPAINLLRQGAAEAISIGAYSDAERLLHRSIALLNDAPDSEEVRRGQVVAYTTLGAILTQTFGFTADVVRDAYMKGFEIGQTVESVTSDLAPAYWGLFTYQVLFGDVKAALKTDELLRSLSNRNVHGERNAEVRLASLATKNAACFYSGDFSGHFEQIDQIRGLYDFAEHSPLVAVYGLDIFATAQLFEPHARAITGVPNKVMPLIYEADKHQAKLNIPLMLPYAAVWGGVALIWLGDLEGAIARINEGITLADNQGAAFWSATGRMWLAVAQNEQSICVESIEAMNASLEIHNLMGVGIAVPYWSMVSAHAAARLGDIEGGLVAAMTAETAELAVGEGCWSAEIYRLHGRILYYAGHADATTEKLWQAVELAEKQGARLWQMRALLDLDEVSPSDHVTAQIAALRALMPDMDERQNPTPVKGAQRVKL